MKIIDALTSIGIRKTFSVGKSIHIKKNGHTVCTKRLAHFYIMSIMCKLDTISWTYSIDEKQQMSLILITISKELSVKRCYGEVLEKGESPQRHSTSLLETGLNIRYGRLSLMQGGLKDRGTSLNIRIRY